MDRIEISLAEDYCPSWGLWEGIRELVQNYMDATDAGFPGAVEHSGNKLVLRNAGAAMTRAQMSLFGATTKAGDDNARGQFGEGFKIGLLALLRGGKEAIIVTPHGTYIPRIVDSNMFQARVLAFEQTDEEPNDGVSVEVIGISESEWSQFDRRFLWDSPRDSILTERPGDVFVRDIWVGHFPDYRLGYNFASMQTDRDRKLIDAWTLRYHASLLVERAVANDRMPAENVLDLIMADAEDVRYIHNHATQKSRSRIAAAFKDRHGDAAVAVGTMEQVHEAEHHGLKPVVAPAVAVELLDECSKIAYRMSELQSSVNPEDMTEDEKEHLRWAINLVESTGEPKTIMKVVDFVQSSMLGRREGDAIYIARKVLLDKVETLTGVVEEFAHAYGGDGSKAHTDALHRIYSKIVCAS